MQHEIIINKIAVLGAGVMGAQIAAHCVNAGMATLLYDLAPKEGGPNSLVEKAIANLGKLKPSPLGTAGIAGLLQARNYEHDLAQLADCDLVIEAIAERLDWKEDLYKRIAPHLGQHTILVSNTSGLSINSLSEVLPAALRTRFCGVHFFNPPRYMHLAELIPSKHSSKSLLNQLETWLTRDLGKGVVIARDTPNFIANRVGVFSLLTTLRRAEEMNIGLDIVDALTGVAIGRPKSATFRTMDVVGLDTMAHVVRTMQEHLKDDPWHHMYHLPSWLSKLIHEGHLGQKTGQGIYRKAGKNIEVLDIYSGVYRLSNGQVNDEVQAILKEKSIRVKMQKLADCSHKQAQFLTACFRDLFQYCAYHLQEIADSVRDVDNAMRWGFGWQMGPFEIWQAIGMSDWIARINQAIAEKTAVCDAALPKWLTDKVTFFTHDGAYSPATNQQQAVSPLPVYKRQLLLDDTSPVIYDNAGVVLRQFQDAWGVVTFKTKANTVDQAVLDGLQEALAKATATCGGLIIYQHDKDNFSSGADLRAVNGLIQANRWDDLAKMVAEFQAVAMALKYSAIPTVAAVRGRALGGGCELMMHCGAVVAGFESYPGLVEVGAGLIPAGGGCCEFALRTAEKAGDADLMLFLQPVFQRLATAYVSGSACDAQVNGFLRATDRWVMNQNEVLFAAVNKLQTMQSFNYHPPLPTRFKVAGREGHARIRAGLVNWLHGGFISQHDYYLSDLLAGVLCGGDVNAGTLVDEHWVLKREQEAFVTLAQHPMTQARINSLLETGKPLRN